MVTKWETRHYRLRQVRIDPGTIMAITFDDTSQMNESIKKNGVFYSETTRMMT